MTFAYDFWKEATFWPLIYGCCFLPVGLMSKEGCRATDVFSLFSFWSRVWCCLFLWYVKMSFFWCQQRPTLLIFLQSPDLLWKQPLLGTRIFQLSPSLAGELIALKQQKGLWLLVVVVVVTQYYSYSSYFGGHAAVFDSVVMCPARQRHTARTVPAFFWGLSQWHLQRCVLLYTFAVVLVAARPVAVRSVS